VVVVVLLDLPPTPVRTEVPLSVRGRVTVVVLERPPMPEVVDDRPLTVELDRVEVVDDPREPPIAACASVVGSEQPTKVRAASTANTDGSLRNTSFTSS
jgi:hypothetical protein